ncbi:MAG: glycosyltransferase family 2 protein [Microbacteriaceae bacterium]
MSLVNRVLRAGYDFLSRPGFATLSDALLNTEYRLRALWVRTFKPNRNVPKVTVVIPVFNVERYLPTCLNSLAAQSYGNLHVVVVDDGSTDGSLDIAKSYLTKLNLTIVEQRNAGISAARNNGVKSISSTDYMMFLDSDDSFAANAIKVLVRQAEKTGSDFVMADTLRTKGIVWIKRIDTREVFAKGTLERTTFAAHPPVIQDLTAWNRLFRWEFYKSHNIEFPEGRFFEDFTTMTRALLYADSFDILAKPIYHWRVRTEGMRSVTQQGNDATKFTHRIEELEKVKAMIQAGIKADRATHANLEAFSSRVMKHDLRLHPDKLEELKCLAAID